MVFKVAKTSDEMEDRRELLTYKALVVVEEGPVGIQSREELKDIILHHFGIRKHELYVYCSYPKPYIVIFSEKATRDVVFAAARIVDGHVELSIHAWDIDRFGDRVDLPYHVKLIIEGIPQHAWVPLIEDKVLCDEAIIHHIEEALRRRTDQRFYACGAFSQDPSRIPQLVYLSLTKHEVDQGKVANIYFTRPKGVKKAHVSRVLVHIDIVEDLLFCHHPREELLKEGWLQWCDFTWRSDRADGDGLDDEEDILPPTRYCGPDRDPDRHPRYDEDGDHDHKRPRFRSLVQHVSN